jgi:hypothetical protein
VSQYQTLEEKEEFLKVGKTGDMIISLGFAFKNATQRIGETPPATENKLAVSPTSVPVALSR